MTTKTKKGPEGWDFQETRDGVQGTRRHPSDPTVERTVVGEDMDDAHAKAVALDQTHEQRETAEADAKRERAARLKEEAKALEDGKEYVAKSGVDGVTSLPKADKEALREHALRNQQLATLVGS